MSAVEIGAHGWTFVAPHPDDVALSCGALVAMLARRQPVTVLTAFNASAAGGDDDFVTFQHQRWGVDANTVADVRDREDAAAVTALGDNVQLQRANLLDAIYRHAAYNSDEALFGELLAEDADTLQTLVDLLDRQPGTVVVPLGIGNHIDHQLAFAAGRRLAAQGREVLAYADVPYVLSTSPEQLRAWLESVGLGNTAPVTWPIDDDAFARGIAAISAYATQIPVIFRDDPDWQPRIDAHLRGSSNIDQRIALLWPLPDGEQD